MAGNTSVASGALSITVDTAVAAPAALDLVALSDSNIDDDNITNDNTPTITGTGEVGATVTLTSDVDGVVGTTVVAGDGTWSITASVLADDVHSLTATQTDVAGNTSVASGALSVTIDTVDPTNTFDGAYYDAASNTLTLSGTNMLTLLSSGETPPTEIREHLDWSKLVWDINGDDAGTGNVGFNLGNITSATVLDDYTLQIVLTGAAATSLEGTAGYGITGDVDTIDINAGFSVDAAGNIASADGVNNAALLGDMNIPAFAHPYTFTPGGANLVVDGLTGLAEADNNISFDVARGDTLTFFGGLSASDVTSVSGGAVASGAGNVTIGISGQTIILEGFTGELDGSDVLFADGSFLKTNNGAAASLFGGVMDDMLIAGNGGDTLVGYGGNDMLFGGTGNDVIYGGAGLDIIHGGLGSDYISGGAGVDTFLYTKATTTDDGKDIITDFTEGAGGDVIFVTDMSEVDVNAAYASWCAQSGNDTLVTMGAGETIRLIGVTAADLTADNFLGN